METNQNEIVSSNTHSSRQNTIHVKQKGQDTPLAIKMVADHSIKLNVVLSKQSGNWFIDLLTEKRILKNSEIVFVMQNGSDVILSVTTGAIKFPSHWRTIALIGNAQFLKLKNDLLSHLIIKAPSQQGDILFYFASDEQGAELFKKVCELLYTATLPTQTNQKPADEIIQAADQNGEADRFQPLNRQYNLNTKYGRKMARQQAAYNYNNGPDQYRSDIDQIKNVVWAFVIVVIIVIFIVVCLVSGPDAAVKMLK